MSLRQTAIATIAAGLAAGFGCEQDPVSSVDEIVQEYVFQVEYESSWFPTLVGIVIDRRGTVARYAREGSRQPPASEAGYTRGELDEKYAHAVELTRIDAATLVQRFNQTLTVRERFTQPTVVCADAGYLDYTAFAYDATTGRYHPLTLRSEGDAARQNVSGDARDLSDWLRDLLTTHPVEGLQPFQEGSCTP